MHKHLHVFFLSLIAIYVFGFEYLPLQDYPNWVYHGYIFNQYVFHGDNFSGFFHLYPYLPPNAICTLGIGCLSLIISPLLAGKLFLFATAVMLYSGIASYLSFHLKDQEPVAAVAAFYLVFNLNFLMGFLNYCFGLGLALLVIVYLEKNELRINRYLFSVLLLLLYLSHFIALGIVLLFLSIYTHHSKKYKELISLLPSFVPVLIPFTHYELTKPFGDVDLSTYSIPFIWRIHLIFHSLFAIIMPFHSHKWVQDTAQIFRNLNYGFCAFLAIGTSYVFSGLRKKKRLSLEFRLTIILLFLIVFLPNYFGGVTMPSTRFTIFFAINIIILFFRKVGHAILRRIIFIAAICLSLVSYGHNMWQAVCFDAIISSGTIPLNAIMHIGWTFEGTDGFEHVYFYHGIRHHEALRTFKSGLFDYPDMGVDNLGCNAR